ncbi:MAG TPA: hypothetical protein VMQ76_10670, partial [Terracidiphilus sp.]|nr:hypothetical protein [Terracidiphilus sp.]
RTARLGSEDQQLQNVRDQFKAMIESKGKAAGEMRQGVTAYNDVAKQAAELGKQAQTAGNLELHDTEAGPLMINRQTGVAQHVTVDGQPVGPKVQLKESQPLMGADNKPHTYMLDEKGNKVVDLGVHYERPVNVNVGGGGGAPGTPGKTGPEYLASLSPNIAATVKAIGEYREPPPNAANRSKEAQQLLSAVNQVYPEFKADIWPTLTAARKSFTSSGVGTVVNSFNTALQHLDRLQSNIPLGTGLSTINAVENVFTPSGSKRGLTLGKFDTDANAVSNEVQKAYKGGVVTNDEYRTMMNLLDRNAAPDRIRSNIGELRQLLKGKLDSFRRQYESGLPPGSVIPLETLGLNGPDTRSGAMGAGGAQPAATSGGDNWFTQHPKAK